MSDKKPGLLSLRDAIILLCCMALYPILVAVAETLEIYQNVRGEREE
jgi:hypothetical protein